MLTTIITTSISRNYLIMNFKAVTLTFKTYWQFKDYPHLKVTKCKKIINEKTGNLLSYSTRGFYINGSYYKRKDINQMLETIPKYIIFENQMGIQ